MLLFFFDGHGYFLSLADRAFSSALLLENLAEERQDGPILFRTQVFLEGNQGFEIEDAHANSVADVLFDGVRKQVGVDEASTDAAENVKRTKASDEVEVAGAGDVAGVRLDPAFGLEAKGGIQGFEHRKKARDIGGIAGVDDVEIQGVDRRTV